MHNLLVPPNNMHLDLLLPLELIQLHAPDNHDLILIQVTHEKTIF